MRAMPAPLAVRPDAPYIDLPGATPERVAFTRLRQRRANPRAAACIAMGAP